MTASILLSACLLSAFAPEADEKPLAWAIVLVDPGHGGQRYSKSYTGGTKGVASKLTESELNLRVSLELVKALENAGATVHITRVADHRLSREGSNQIAELHARVDFIEHFNPHFFISVHHNAGAETATGHTALYKHNATDDTLYESLATRVNEALAGSVPGPKRSLIKGNYHILRETETPGTISESGFMTNRAYDEASNKPDYPKREAAALARGAIDYWAKHKEALIALRTRLAKERNAKPRDPNTFSATAINPAFQKRMAERLAAVAPGKMCDPKNVGEYLAKYRTLVVTDPKIAFTVKATYDGTVIRLAGETSDRAYHDQFIDLLVAMKLYEIVDEIVIPKVAK